MQSPSMLKKCNMLINQVLMEGNTPVALLMNESTRMILAETVKSIKRRSSWTRFLDALLNRKFELTHLLGVPVITSPYLPLGGISIQAISAATVAASEAQGEAVVSPEAIQWQEGGNAGQEDRDAAEKDMLKRGQEFWDKQAVGTAETEDRAPTLSDLAASAGNVRPSASSILMKAMDNVDELSGVMVIRVYPNNNIDMALNMDIFAAQGVLQRAQMYLMQRGQ